MIMNNLLLFIAFFGFITLNNVNFAQSDSTRYKVTKNDGTQYVGVLIKNDAKEVILITESLGEVAIPKHTIKSIEKVDPSEIQQDGAIWSRNLLASRYSITTNGFPVRKHEGYLKVMPLGLDFQFALTDNWSLGGMASWYGVPLILTTKYSHEISPTLNVSGGLLYGNLLYASNIFGNGGSFTTGGGIAFGNLTFGTEERNFNISTGYGFVHNSSNQNDPITGELIGSNIESNGAGMFSVAGMARVSEQATLVFDSMGLIYDGDIYFMINPAVRYMPKPQNIWQFGMSMVGYTEEVLPLPIPMISFTIVFIE
ncbi:MAG: hypothetical protein ACI8ZM_002943 [Crocinitomix sp.]|jgi:hypothetical protein